MIEQTKDNTNISCDVIEFLKEKDAFSQNVHFATCKEKRPSRRKLILVNTLFAIQDEDTQEIDGHLNINIQDSDKIWIEYTSELINLYVDESTIGDFRLEYTTEHLFKVSENLFFKNLKFKFTSL
ncbi:Uncharacterised protein [Sphingobacterium spiritivorum]|uniref:Uncharacterized protein n=1 Tax=Sphingobacterium spiritivorum TaxID=258 RepID=A0A380CFT2_SPHSI|nr:Uncharacterised protein [Sphingobacterium spiritivorum]